MAKYGQKTEKLMDKTMHEFKEGKLKSGGNHKVVRNRKQAVAIGLSEAKQKGYKVPNKG